MRVAYFDCFAGVAGDMIVGALLDAGLELSDLERELEKLGVGGFSVTAHRTEKNGISGTKFDVVAEEDGVARSAAEIVSIVEGSSLDEDVKRTSAKILLALARTESRIHGKEIAKIHLHEVGGIDAIVDVVASVVGLKLLGVDAVRSSPIQVGTGFIECAHGTLPVPAPATLALLDGVPVVSSGIEAELSTPTGVAVITTLAAEEGDPGGAPLGGGFGPMPSMRIETTGYGAGTRDLPIPNLLRVTLGESEALRGTDARETQTSPRDAGEAVLLETNIDDMSPELVAYACERLLELGALDVFTMPIAMKKNRLGVLLSVLARPEDADVLTAALFAETSTLGVRVGTARREVLEREIIEVASRFGTATVKVGRRDGAVVNIAPEYESVRAIALERGVPLKDVYAEVVTSARKVLEK